jgi:hypothetical protein
MIVGEQLNLTVDFTNVLGGQVVDFPIILVTDEATNELVPTAIVGTPFFLGNILRFTFTSTPLQVGNTYIVTFMATYIDNPSLNGGAIIGEVLVVDTDPLDLIEDVIIGEVLVVDTDLPLNGVQMTTIVLTVDVLY